MALLDGRPALRDAIYHITARDQPLEPVQVSVGEAASGRRDADFIALEGLLLDHLRQQDREVFFLTGGGREFSAQTAAGAGASPGPLPRNSWVRLAGICLPGRPLPPGARPARRSLGLAREMLRHSQSEARRSVWELRSQALERGGLPSRSWPRR